MQIKKSFITYFIVVAICYMFIVTVASYFGFGTDPFSVGTHRAQLLTIILGIGILSVVSNRIIYYNRIVIAGFLMTFYMLMLGFSHNSDLLSWLSCTVMWFLCIAILYNLPVQEKDIRKLAVVLAATSVALALMFSYGIVADGIIHTVANSNSIYYVLTAVPFIFMMQTAWFQTIALMCVSGAIMLSGKSTCLIALLFIWIAFALNYLRKKELSISQLVSRLLSLVIGIIIVWEIIRTYVFADSLGNIFLQVWEELQSGGNGRADIYHSALTAFSNSNILRMIVGHGYNSINETIHIGTHNDFLMVLYNYGIIGFGLYIFFWGSLLRGFFELRKQQSDYTLAYIVSLIVFFWVSMASNVLNTQIQFMLLCIFWGLCVPGKIILESE